MKSNKKYIAIAFALILLSVSTSAFASTKIVKHKAKKVVAKKEVIQKKIVGDTVTFDVSGTIYTAEVVKGSTVYDAMLELENKKSSNFTFHSKDYSGLGSFVDEINGVRGAPGKYWLYYINNKKASLGVSKYVVADGDRITWKQEGF